MKLDDKDIKILNLLQKNARLSNKEIAFELAIPTSTCHERLKRLHKLGVFKSFGIELNLNKLGFNLEAMIFIKLSNHDREFIHSFIKKIRTIHGVIKFYHMTGDIDFIIHVAAKDSISLRIFILDELAHINYIKRIETKIIFNHEYTNQLEFKNQ
ncbi:Lrp/AsnC family transcriptional regulator [Flavobacterium sp.]|jgi:Lrp/AsnC family leucine-responsive transcriptional regulator|uniref:Lrp/AsnC family transcriptional regulator n=1 Tax=Flavobacterium sp. TaxID=239 RepID=UPI0040478110